MIFLCLDAPKKRACESGAQLLLVPQLPLLTTAHIQAGASDEKVVRELFSGFKEIFWYVTVTLCFWSPSPALTVNEGMK